MVRVRRWILGTAAATCAAGALGLVACNALTGLDANYVEVDCSDASCADAPAPDAADDTDAGVVDGGTCSSYVASVCQFMAQCEPGTLQQQYGTTSYCQMVLSRRCENGLDLPGTVATPGWLAACGAEYQAAANACDAGPVPLPLPRPSDACGTGGAYSGGAPCAVDEQCASLLCVHTGNVCGTCFPTGGQGAACAVNVDCKHGLGCGPPNKCEPLVGVGAACDRGVSTVCVLGSDCVLGDAGAKMGTCVASLTTEGASCTVDGMGGPECSLIAGFFCDATRHCKKIQYVKNGACGFLDSGLVSCEVGACIGSACSQPASQGESCMPNQAPGCTPGTLCLYGDAATATCAPFDPTACAAAH